MNIKIYPTIPTVKLDDFCFDKTLINIPSKILLICLNISKVFKQVLKLFTASKVSKYGVFSGLYFPTFGLNMTNIDKH